MIRDSIDDIGRPFEPETPGEFYRRGEEAFHIWWSELYLPGWSGGLELEYETARAVWSATYEQNADCILLVYDGAEANAGGAHETGEMQLACVVHHHHDGGSTLRNRDFIDWVAKYEDRIRQEYHEGEHMDDDKVTVWIDHDGQSPPTSNPINRTQPHSSDNLRVAAEKRFRVWWKQLNPHGMLAWMTLDRDAARVVWHESFAKLWEDLELVHDSAKAYADVIVYDTT